MSQIEIKNLFKVFGPNPAAGLNLLKKGKTKEEIHEQTGLTVGVQDASFTVNSGEIFVVMGLSGSGKSTLVRMLNRLIEPTSGAVIVDGENVMEMDKDRSRLHRRLSLGNTCTHRRTFFGAGRATSSRRKKEMSGGGERRDRSKTLPHSRRRRGSSSSISSSSCGGRSKSRRYTQ